MASQFDEDRIQEGVRLILQGIGEDPGREGLRDTPRRVSEMFREVVGGLLEDPEATVNSVLDVAHDEMIMVRDIPLHSLCVGGQELVNTTNGTAPASRIGRGTELWTFDDEGFLTTTRVLSTAWHRTDELVAVRAGGRTIRVTPEHPIETPDGWIVASELKAGHKVRQVNTRMLNQERHPVREGYSLGYVLGIVGSDGSVQEGRRVSVVVNSHTYASRFSAALFDAFGVARPLEEIRVPSGFRREKIDMFRVRVVSRRIGSLLLHWFGGSKATKEFHFPRVVLRSREMMEGFLDGYCDGDGYWKDRPGGGRGIVSANRQFLEELGSVLGGRPRKANEGVWHLYVPSNWARVGWRGQPGFQPRDVPLLPADGDWSSVEWVRRFRQGGTKPFRVYSIECAPHPSFLVGGIHVHNCEHHLLPFFGKAHVAYIPGDDGRITGLSKLARLVDVLAKRPQVQERLTTQVADVLEKVLKPRGVFVMIEAEHLCMSMRGVKKPGSETVTSAVRGVFRSDPRTRAEAMGLIRGSRT